MLPTRRLLSLATLTALLAGALLPAPAALAGRLVWGPMLGYQEHREVLIKLEVADADEVTLDYWLTGRPETQRTARLAGPTELPLNPAGGRIASFVLPLLEPGATYTYTVAIDGEQPALPQPLTFRTKAQFEWREPPPDFSFLFGSCAYFNDPPYDRPGRPYGAGTAIFGPMAASGADFMIWGGDNIYLREADWSSESGIWYRYQTDRATPALQPLLAAMPHYATWDDHDFGPNNSNKGYELKAVTLAAFTAHWGNRTWGEPDNPGVYGKFQYGDAAFFLLDNRYHRDESEIDPATPGKSQYGRRQLDWLKQNLAAMNEGNNRRHSPIRFIVTGGQFTADRTYRGVEGNVVFPEERAELLAFIREHKISGVIFLSGDVHYTELLRRDDLLPYPLYELTSSPLASGAHTGNLGEAPHRVDGTLVQTQNYCRIAISGPADNRVVTLTSHSQTGEQLWQHTIRVADLQVP